MHIASHAGRGRLEEVETAASSGKWVNASQSLTSLTNDLASYESEASEARELLDFIQSEWSELRRRLDSSSIGPTDESRRATEAAVKEAAPAKGQQLSGGLEGKGNVEERGGPLDAADSCPVASREELHLDGQHDDVE